MRAQGFYLTTRCAAIALLAAALVYAQADREAVQAGDSHFRAGRFAPALAEYLRAKEIAALSPDATSATRVRIVRQIVACRLLSEQIHEARQEFREASNTLGRDPAWAPYERLVGAEIDAAASAYRTAAESYAAALADTRLPAADRAQAAAGFAEVQIWAGELSSAARTVNSLKDLARELGQARVHFLEGLLQLESGATALALRTLRQGVTEAEAERSGKSQDPLLAKLLFAESAAWLRAGDLSQAAQKLQAGKALCQAVPAVSEWGLRLQGEISLENGQPDLGAIGSSLMLSADQVPDEALPRLHATWLRTRANASANPATAPRLLADQAERIRRQLGDAHPLTASAVLLQVAALLPADRAEGERTVARLLGAVDRVYAAVPTVRAFWRIEAARLFEEFGLDTAAFDTYSAAYDLVRGNPQTGAEQEFDGLNGMLLTQGELGRWTGAERTATLLHPPAPPVLPWRQARHLLALGNFELHRGELEKAEASLQAARGATPANRKAFAARIDFRLAELASRRARTDAAIKLYESSLPLLPPRPAVAAAWAGQGRNLLKANRPQDAEGAFRQAWQITLALPPNPAARWDGFVPLAVKNLLQRRNPADADTMLASWFDWCEKNRLRLAQETDAELQELLTYLLEAKDYQRADRMLGRAIPMVAITPAFDQLISTAAETSEKAGNFRSAAQYSESIAARHRRRREFPLEQDALQRAIANLDRSPGVAIQAQCRVRLLLVDSLLAEARRPVNEGNSALLGRLRENLDGASKLLSQVSPAPPALNISQSVDAAWIDILDGKNLDGAQTRLRQAESDATRLGEGREAALSRVYYGLGAAALKQGDTQAAAANFEKSLGFAASAGDEDMTAGMVDDIAYANYEKRSMLEPAEAMFKNYLRLCREKYGEGSDELAEAAIHYANFLDRHQRYKEAIAQAEIAQQAYASRLGELSAEVIEAISLLARLQIKDNSPNRAATLLAEALRLRRAGGRLKAGEEIRLLQELGRTLIAADLQKQAAGTFGALAALTEARDAGVLSPETVAALIAQVGCTVQAGQPAEGARLYQSLRARLQKDRKRYLDFEQSLMRGYAGALEKTGKQAEARKLRTEADRLSAKR